MWQSTTEAGERTASAASSAGAESSATTVDDAPFAALDASFSAGGAEAVLARLVEELERVNAHRALLDAYLLKARYEIGLPLVQAGPLNEIAEPQRSRYEQRYVESIRAVGRRFLDAGDIAAAWPYFRAIAEHEPIAAAIEAFEPVEGDENLPRIVEVAFSQGAHPERGFQLILDNYGVCSAISAYDQLPPDDAIRVRCAERLTRVLHRQLSENLRWEIEHRGEPKPAADASILDLVQSRSWLFDDDAYHVDASHLAATVRLSPLLRERETIALARDLTEYGRRLSRRHRYEGESPFDDVYEDHHAYLSGLLGIDVETSLARFRSKLSPDPASSADAGAERDAGEEGDALWGEGPSEADRAHDRMLAAQALVTLLERLGRLEEAIDVAAESFAEVPDAMLRCPNLAQLCVRAGRLDRLAAASRSHGDLMNYATALVERARSPAG